jgi:hypothetical protein
VRVRRRRRRILGAVLAVVYLGAFVWLVSPLWGSADSPPPELAPVREVRSGGSVGLAPLGNSKPLPVSLPGSSPATTASESEAGAEETLSEGEGEVEATSSAPEVSEEPASTAPSTESSSPSSSETIIGGEG